MGLSLPRDPDLRRWAEARAAGRASRAAALRGRLPAAVEILRERYGATRIVLFGSVARGAAGVDSDVDLLVEGVPAARLWEAEADVSLVLGVPVDLVPRDRARRAVLDDALHGEVLFDAG